MCLLLIIKIFSDCALDPVEESTFYYQQFDTILKTSNEFWQ
jgi:hypothetical protein